jgi:LmbE family N-acetylglucosaminyl deacetylase
MRKKATIKTRLIRKTAQAVLPAVKLICEPPKLENVKRALFIQPHPDDNQIAAGGTIAWLVDRGAEVYELTVLDDRYTDLTYSGEGYTVRQKEALEAQRVLGIKNAGFLGFGDRTEASAREISKEIVKVIRFIQPDIIFTADPNLSTECHEDHIKVGMAVKYAFMDARFPFYPEYDNGKPRTDIWNTPALALYYTAEPNTLVDIGRYEELKFKAVHAHVSQREPALDVAIRLLSRHLAEGTAYEAAETFRVLSQRHAHCFNLPVE